MIYRHPKFSHTQTVGEWEKVRRSVLERAGWKADPEPGPNVPAVGDLAKTIAPPDAPKPRRPRKASK